MTDETTEAVERLTYWSDHFEPYGASPDPDDICLILSHSATQGEEIERLKAELADALAYTEQLDKSWYEIAEQRLAERCAERSRAEASEARVGRLEEALRELMAAQAHYDHMRATSIYENIEKAADRLTDARLTAEALHTQEVGS